MLSSPPLNTSGAELFIKYAFAPNKLRFCGPSDNGAIFNYLKKQKSDRDLMILLTKFEGAYPYLEYIAHVNKISNPFDERVVEAYWIGNELLGNVSIANFYEYLKDRFKGQWDKKSFTMLFSNNKVGAKPHHSFHVLSGFAKNKLPKSIVNFIENCTISTGKIVSIETGKINMETKILESHNNKLSYSEKTIRQINCVEDLGQNLQRFAIGDTVSYHWGWVCDRLGSKQETQLNYWNQYHLDIFNTIL